MLPREVTRKVGEVGSLRGLEFGIMDEILNEKMTNRDFCATDISRYMGVGYRSLNQAFWMHNVHKIDFGMLAPDTSITDPQIKPRLRIWNSYRKFIDQGGCSEPFDPKVLAAVLFPKLTNIDKVKEGYVIRQSLKGRPLPRGMRRALTAHPRCCILQPPRKLFAHTSHFSFTGRDRVLGPYQSYCRQWRNVTLRSQHESEQRCPHVHISWQTPAALTPRLPHRRIQHFKVMA